MNCKTVKSQLTDYILEQLDAKFQKDLETHLQSCPDCQAELSALRKVWTELDAVQEAEPSPMLKSRFYQMLESEKKYTVHGIQYTERASLWDRVDQWLVHWWPRRPATQFGVSAVILLLGLWLGNGLSNRAVRNGEMTALRSEVREMRQFMSMSLMNQPSSVQRIQGVNLTEQVKNPDASLLEALFHTLNSDPSVNVRLEAVDALYLFRDKENVRAQLLKSLEIQNSPLVQVALIDLIIQLKEQKALDALKSLIQKEDVNPDVREYAERKTLEMS